MLMTSIKHYELSYIMIILDIYYELWILQNKKINLFFIFSVKIQYDEF